jgi:hypothetical protein
MAVTFETPFAIFSWAPLAQGALHSGGGLVAHARQKVRVDAQSELDVRMPQDLLHKFGVHSLGE